MNGQVAVNPCLQCKHYFYASFDRSFTIFAVFKPCFPVVGPLEPTQSLLQVSQVPTRIPSSWCLVSLVMGLFENTLECLPRLPRMTMNCPYQLELRMFHLNMMQKNSEVFYFDL